MVEAPCDLAQQMALSSPEIGSGVLSFQAGQLCRCLVVLHPDMQMHPYGLVTARLLWAAFDSYRYDLVVWGSGLMVAAGLQSQRVSPSPCRLHPHFSQWSPVPSDAACGPGGGPATHLLQEWVVLQTVVLQAVGYHDPQQAGPGQAVQKWVQSGLTSALEAA